MPRSRLIASLAIFSVIFVVGELFFVPKTAMNSAFLSALQAPGVFFTSLYNKHLLITRLQDLSIENQALRGQLAQAQAVPRIMESGRDSFIRAVVYSAYPLTSSKVLTIGAGSKEGVAVGMPVVIKPGLFVGEVAQIFDHQALVRTIFDATRTATSTPWQLAVKIGKNATDALLIADLEPKLTIISRKKVIASGDDVILAGKQYPYGLSVGSVGSIIDNPSNVFLEATLSEQYAFSDLSEVFVMLPR
jgi:cell shape-determining protein MreC